jgi:hypothetical protein
VHAHWIELFVMLCQEDSEVKIIENRCKNTSEEEKKWNNKKKKRKKKLRNKTQPETPAHTPSVDLRNFNKTNQPAANNKQTGHKNETKRTNFSLSHSFCFHQTYNILSPDITRNHRRRRRLLPLLFYVKSVKFCIIYNPDKPSVYGVCWFLVCTCTILLV